MSHPKGRRLNSSGAGCSRSGKPDLASADRGSPLPECMSASGSVADIDANATVAPPDACTDRLRTGPVLIMALGDEPG
jgi:hypothetical protein